MPVLNLGIRGKLFGVSCLLIVAAGAASGLYLENSLRRWIERRIERELARHARTTRVLVERSGPGLDSIRTVDRMAGRIGSATEARITVIAPDGTVLGDSEVPTERVHELENHAERPEIREAFEADNDTESVDEKGVARRYSSTLGQSMLYVAIPYEFDETRTGVVRAALSLESVDAIIRRLRIFLGVAAVLGLVVAVSMSGWASHLAARSVRKLVDRVRQSISDDDREASDAYRGLVGSIQQMSRELNDKVETLALERDRFEAILQSMTEAVIVLDADRDITLINDTASEWFGPRAEVIDRPLLDVIRVPDLQELLDETDETSGASEEFELPGSENRAVLAHASYQPTTGGFVVVMHDVTRLRRLERIRQDFVANVSHELRTPVSIIQANAETLLDGALEDPEHAEEFTRALLRHAKRLSALISDLLDLSKIEAGEYDFERTAVSVGRVAERVRESVPATAGATDTSISIDLDRDCEVLADEGALEQVLVNLVENAVKYSDEGGRVEIRDAPAHQAPDGAARLEVVDDGPGIPPEDRSRIFERFYRVDAGRSRELGGTGLGLSIVRHLVENMGGEVGYEAREPRGSIFWFELPTR